MNDAILPGPKLQREIVDVLTHFCRAPIALTADISEIFLQVNLGEEDHQYHRFIWRNYDSNEEPTVFEFHRLLFGNTALPISAQYVLHYHAETHSREFPEAAESVNDSMYVDDLLDSCNIAKDAKNLQTQLSNLLTLAGFNL